MRMVLNKHRHSKKAFTLTELIVVLVILAVLAAMLVPALTGYIRRARKEKYYDQAHYALTAAQSVMSELYAKGVAPAEGVGKADVDWAKSDYGKELLELFDCGRGAANGEPYILIFGVGMYDSYASNEETEALPYTVMFIAYVATEDSPAVFYVDGTWTYEYPWNDNSMVGGAGNPNVINVGPHKGAQITLYVVSNRTGKSITSSGFWTGDNVSLRAHSEPYFKG